MLKNPDLFRRNVAGVAMLVWPLLELAAFLTSPPGTTHAPDVFASRPVQVQVSALLFQWGTIAMIPAILGLAHLLRTRMPRTGNIGAAIGAVGAASAIALFTTDFYDLALAQTLPAEQAVRVTEAANALGGFVYGMLLPGFLVHVGVLTLMVGLALAKAGPWWLPVVTLMGVMGPFLTMGQTPAVQSIGALFQFAAFGWVAVKVLRMPVADWKAA
ncbi:hypothetical protein IMZ11_05900 [Microtetraspora sp. AC03309]|uniref:hypothetical protein n=1 Tax=Microtetraspora sp. AC03309 TaxID=2779376 RepID=UPI001E4EE0ED|nr:hypothetical protein [Microtetraspora sp. AC03309]MCC5575173.1 hypothetical protein [Microtetraspora sp. AC03309]